MTTTTEPNHFGGEGLDVQSLNLMIEALNDFVLDALSPELQLELDHEDRCPEDIVRGMSDPEVLGVQLVFVPDEYGGMGGGAMDAYRVCEVMARHDIGLATAVFATFLGSDPIVVGATEEQKHRWLGAIAEKGVVFAYGATEPEAGSDLGALTTTATPIKDDEGNTTGYRINGRKQWISNGSIAEHTTILATTDAGPSWFVVDRGTPGFTASPPEDKHGLRLSNTAALFLDEVEIPADSLIGTEEGKGMWQAQQVFGYTRVMVAAFGLGGGWEALDRAIQYSINREQGGGPLSEKQGFTHKLIIPHVVKLEAARAFIEETSSQIDQGLGAGGGMNTEGAIAKYMATVFGNLAADDAIQAHGGYGYTRPYVVEKIKRDVRITEIYEGTSEICEMTIARDRWQLHLKNKFRYYEDMAVASEQLHARHPNVGADIAALAARSLNVVLEACRMARLTREQHILFRLGELMAWAETACVFSQRAAAMIEGTPYPKTPSRFNGETTAAQARAFAREAAQKVLTDGTRWVAGAVPAGSPAVGYLANLPTAAVQAAQAGWLDDMNFIADVIYGRAG